jgi:hypothetical protein
VAIENGVFANTFVELEIMYLEARANSVVDTTMPDFYDTCTAMLNYVEDKGLSSERVTDLVSVVSTD